MNVVDLNCDLGESFGTYRMGNDKEILDYVTSVNVACGFHAGDPSVMRETVQLALEKGVRIGAHPGLPDLMGFGRRNMNIAPQEAYDIVVYQIGALNGFLQSEGGSMQHVKPHGALYNMAARNEALSLAIAEAIYKVNQELILFGLSGSELIRAGEAVGLRTASEVFADRTYQEDGSLTSRLEKHALLENDEDAAAQAIRMVKEGKVMSQQGSDVALRADTICIHGDGAHALTFAQHVKNSLELSEITVKSFT
ncbi:lactam utilization protein LamB [Peribacillus muralis]|uniref:5-oxoprolinase subunit A n=1 Tax=Peribacillus muralis TaxID=264697 RepID=A0A1B3XNK8_9BACI|nr:5-oxoprolinase subunit PxpA [Peribacillus muralis]AOH54792.1 lactam utilization protein LamB [Peribacillus muralis]